MRKTTLLLGSVACALLIGLAGTVGATQRATLLQLSWGETVPEKVGEPLLFYLTTSEESRDQERFDDVVLANESLLLAAKFFTCVQMSDDAARAHALFADVKFEAPAMVAFESTREKHAVAGGRASGMKVYGMLCKVGQVDYETNLASTVRAARNLLGSFDRIDAAQDALAIKQARLSEAHGDADSAKIRKLEREVEKDQAAIDELAEQTQTRWSEIWDLKRKERGEAAEAD